MSALFQLSDVDLFRDGERIVHLHAQVECPLLAHVCNQGNVSFQASS